MKLYPEFTNDGKVLWWLDAENGTGRTLCETLEEGTIQLAIEAGIYQKQKKIYDQMRGLRPEVVKTIFRDAWEKALDTGGSVSMNIAFSNWLDRVKDHWT